MNNQINQLILSFNQSEKSLDKIKYADLICKAYCNLNNYSLAMDFSTYLLEESVRANYTFGIIEAYNNQGVIYTLQGSYIRATQVLNIARELLQDCFKFDLKVEVLNNLSIVLAKFGKYDDALDLMFEVIELAQKRPNNLLLSRSFNSVATIYKSVGDLDKSLEYSKKALKIKLKLRQTHQEIANAYNNLGCLYRLKKDFALAKGYLKRAERINKKLGNSYQRSVNIGNLGDAYLDQEYYGEAIQLYLKAINYAENADYKPLLALYYKNIGFIYQKSEMHAEAREYYDKTLKYMDYIDDNDTIITIYHSLGNFFEAHADFENAVKFLKKENEIKHRVFHENLSLQTAYIESNFKYEQQKRDAELYRQKNDELIKSNNKIELQKQELEEINNSKDAILNIVSKDLKNTIGGIKTSVEQIKALQLNEKLNKYLNVINDSSLRALELVNDILDANKLDSYDYELDLVSCDLNQILSLFETNLKILSSHKGINCEFYYCPEPVLVLLNNDRFWQILNNLTGNAIKFTHKNGKIIVATQVVELNAQKHCCISIKDNGIGIPEDKLPYIFDRFTKVGRKGTAGEVSTGLGLSIVKRLVDLHHGIIEVKSMVDYGTEFLIYLPIVQED